MYDVFFIVYDSDILKKEIRARFPLAKFFVINDDFSRYDALCSIQKKSLTAMFWVIDIGYEIKKDYNFNFIVPDWDKKYVHVFKEEKTGSYKGVYLFPKNYHITKNESEHLFFINKKEIDITVSCKKELDIFFAIYESIETKNKIQSSFPFAKFLTIDENNTIQDALYKAQKDSSTEIFWFVEAGYTIKENFNLDYIVPSWDRKYVHVFKEEKTDTYKGLYLIPKSYLISKKEAENIFFVNKKEIPIIGCRALDYEVFIVNNYDDYLNAKNKNTTDMFYIVFSDLKVLDTFNFDHYIEKGSRHLNYVFKNGNYYDGIFLTSKTQKITEREFKNRFLLNRTEIDVTASYPNPFDIVFISYSEPNADENYQNLLKRFPTAKRIHGVKGIHQAHKEAAKIVDTVMFWVVDGDAQIVDNFNFDYQVPAWSFDEVHVFRSQNPINGLEYGYGGVKLLPTQLTKNLDINTVDMTTSISLKFKALPEVSNISKFNTDEFNTWKSAFRECVKLSSKIIVGQNDNETLDRLNIWCTEGQDEEYGKFAIKGAVAGKEFGIKYKDDLLMLSKINDWEWLTLKFKEDIQEIING